MSKIRKGFTLIELLVVMFIIAILASLVIVNVSGARKTARDTKRMSDLRTIQGALESYNNKNGSYPRTVSLVNDINSNSAKCTAGSSSEYYCLDGAGPNGYTGMPWYNNTNHLTDPNWWIPGLVAGGFLPNLPQDPKPVIQTAYVYGYNYFSDGISYKIVDWGMETCAIGTYTDLATGVSSQIPNDCTNASNPVSIQEMRDPAFSLNNYWDRDAAPVVGGEIALYSCMGSNDCKAATQ